MKIEDELEMMAQTLADSGSADHGRFLMRAARKIRRLKVTMADMTDRAAPLAGGRNHVVASKRIVEARKLLAEET